MGQYRPHRDLVAAIDDLYLVELPWLAFSGFNDERDRLAYEDRWRHPEVRAWQRRRDARLQPRSRRPPR